MELAAILGVIWTLGLLSFLYSASLSIPPYVNPLGLVCIMLAFLFNPFKMFRYEARFWLLKITVSIIRTDVSLPCERKKKKQIYIYICMYMYMYMYIDMYII